MDTYHLEIGTDHHAPHRATDEVYPTYAEAEEMAKALHVPDWPCSRCVIICNHPTGRACGYTEYSNGRTMIRPA